MYQFIESVKVENQIPFLLKYHQERICQTFAHFDKKQKLDLEKIFKNLNFQENGLFKLRIEYDLKGNFETEVQPYIYPKIDSFELVENPAINYKFKFLDRTGLENIKKKITSQETIILQSGNVTDTSFSNLLFLKNGVWHIPKTYLLNGVQRQNLLSQNKIQESEIRMENLKEFSHFRLINAMNNMDSPLVFPIEKIINL